MRLCGMQVRIVYNAAVRETLSWKDGKANDEVYSAESALNRLLLILNNRIAEEVQKRKKQ